MSFGDIVYFILTGTFKTEVEKLQSAAQKGNAKAQAELGICYYTGRGAPVDDAQAIKWFQSAARLGSAKARFCMGHARLSGRGIAKDPVSAYAWFSVAETDGHKEAEEWRHTVGRELSDDQIKDAEQLAGEMCEHLNGRYTRVHVRPICKD